MRISDWSSDVCSSDLMNMRHRIGDVLLDLLALGRVGGGRVSHCLSDSQLFLVGRNGAAARPLASSCVGASALAAHRQAAAVSQTTIGTEVDQSLDAHRHFTTKITFDDQLADLRTQLFELDRKSTRLNSSH